MDASAYLESFLASMATPMSFMLAPKDCQLIFEPFVLRMWMLLRHALRLCLSARLSTDREAMPLITKCITGSFSPCGRRKEMETVTV